MRYAQLHSHLEGSLKLDFIECSWENRVEVYNWFGSKKRTVEDLLACLNQYGDRTDFFSEIRVDYQGNLTDYSFSKELLKEFRRLPSIYSLRRQNCPLEDTSTIIQLFNDGLICGVDFTGREYGNPPSKFYKVMGKLEYENIPYTYHLGEQSGDEELIQLLKFNPRRIGHGLSISEKNIGLILEKGIHIEVCLTSNIYTKRASLHNHPVLLLYERGCSFSLNEDDSVFFNTNIVNEYAILKSILPEADLDKVYEDTFKASFSSLS
ncbi:MAG: hypothetical protein KKF46_07555 [Nanoarchaeota archaeon]|nr:hypothetical protein [Nanoarchaeota archaeon]MBU1322183.1 hypothetical protein [Nanoarchaeota archaeon]MBU1597724.1 hypothetical protein [Nanoarchaeota archaeon]MBU2442106.1 hypothetical protein [Nanoarchaeota archaeon]